MARMTKTLPKVEQARIKLELSNLVLSAERKYQEMLSLKPAADSICTFQEITFNNNESYFNL